MVARQVELMPDKPNLLLQKLVGCPCTLQRVGSDRSLFLGFGRVDKTTTKPHATTEIGTYDCAWRIVHDGKVICGRSDTVDEVAELHQSLAGIDLGAFVSITAISAFDVRIQFSSGVHVDMLCTISDGDEVMHVFFPEKEVLVFQCGTGWRFGRSDEPWD